MTQCKPCITINTVCQLAKVHWRNFMADVRSYDRVNRLVCKIEFSEGLRKPLRVDPTVAKIRELAMQNYNSGQPGGKCDYPDASVNFSVCDAVRDRSWK